MMENNKLIAEFMGWKPNEHHWCLNGDKDLQYHTEWNWLMPVVEKILDLSFQDDGDAEDFYNIRDCMPDLNHTYKAVIEFIKTKTI